MRRNMFFKRKEKNVCVNVVEIREKEEEKNCIDLRNN